MKGRLIIRIQYGLLILCTLLKLMQFILFSTINWTVIWDFVDWSIWYGIVIPAIIISIKWIKNIKAKNQRIVLLVTSYSVSIVILLYLIYANSSSYFLSSPNNYYYFPSPNKKQMLVVIESENITGCTIKGYPIKLGVFKKEGSDFASFAEPDMPIRKGEYSIVWINNNLVRIKVSSDNTSESFEVNFK